MVKKKKQNKKTLAEMRKGFITITKQHLGVSLSTFMSNLKVPLRRKFVGLFRPNSVAEYRVVSTFTQKTEQETVHPNIF